MRARDVGFVSVTLGALGCGEPARPAPLDAAALFSKDRAEAGGAWRRFLEPQALHAAWAPPAGSLWRPYYKPTLIAAVAVVKDGAAPLRTEEELVGVLERLDLRDAALFIDLPGEQSVVWGAALLGKGFQPVVTFNNWPHQKGLLKLERALGALLLHAEKAAKTRPAGAAPPVFLLEGTRLADKRATPGPDVFDNRYFHAAGDFPGPDRLLGQKLKRVIYVNARGTTPGSEEDDLNAYFYSLRAAGLTFTYVQPAGEDPRIGDLVAVAPRSTLFDAPRVASYAASGTGHAHRPYAQYHGYYHHHFWSSSSGTWGSGSSGGGARSGWST